VELLISASRTSPLVIAIDDFHMADDDSAGLLEFLGQSIADEQILIIAAGRTETGSGSGALDRVLRYLATETNFNHLPLSRMDLESASSLASSIGLANPTSELNDAIFTASEGNPFYVREIVSTLNRLDASSDLTPLQLVSETTRNRIAVRINSVSVDPRELLNVAAVNGLEIDANRPCRSPIRPKIQL
jgi:predicted ATPase